MTVCVAIKVHDCIVFAADSASSLIGNSSVVNIWQHGHKVFNLHKELPIVAMTTGMGHFGPASISNLAKDLRILLSSKDKPLDKSNYTIQQVVEIAQNFFRSKYEALSPPPSDRHSFEFWIGGYGSKGDWGEIWKLRIQDGSTLPLEQIATTENDEIVAWGGQAQAINRLLRGFDDNLKQILVSYGLNEEVAQQLIEQLQKHTVTPLVHSSMPIQDAINLAEFLVDMTKNYFTYLPGANIVGGATDIATVTKHEGFKWIRRKHYYPANLNILETDHAT